MQTEKQRILQLVSEGKIAVEEAVTLLEALDNEGAPKPQPVVAKQEPTQSTTKEQSSEDDIDYKEQQTEKNIFEEEFKQFGKDISSIGSVFMDLVDKTFQKVRDLDIATPFGEKITFQHVQNFDADAVEQIIVEIPNGKVAIEPAELNDIRLVCSVKSPLSFNDEEKTRQEFDDQFVAQADHGVLRIINTLKLVTVDTTIYVPKKQFESLNIRTLNGAVSARELNLHKLKIKTLNGEVKVVDTNFTKADVNTSNGGIELRRVKGNEVEAETINGRVYVDGVLQEIEASSVNGHVIATTYAQNAAKIETSTVAGAVEVYVPSSLALEGKLSTNFGKLDVNLADVTKIDSHDQFLSKSVKFRKEAASQNKLYIDAETKSGSILVRYTTLTEDML